MGKQKTSKGVTVRQLLDEVYSKMFEESAEEVQLPERGFSLIVASDGDYHHESTWVFSYRQAKSVEIGGTLWILSRGYGGKYGAVGLDSDIIAAPTEEPGKIAGWLVNSLIIGSTNGWFKSPSGYNPFKKPLKELMENLSIQNYITRKMVADGREGFLDANTPTEPAVREPFLYKPCFAPVLASGLEEIVKKADPKMSIIR